MQNCLEIFKLNKAKYLKSTIQILFAISISIFMYSCIDPFEIETIKFKSALVLEGPIIGQKEMQGIMVSRTVPLDMVLMSALSKAKVEVKDSNGSIYEFTETSTGVYTSKMPFVAVARFTYSLTIKSNDGKTYLSEETSLPSRSTIGNLYAKFQVSTVLEERIFFNYSDFFPGENLPDYLSDCPFLAPPIVTKDGATSLIDGIEQNLIKYCQLGDLATLDDPGPYYMVYSVC